MAGFLFGQVRLGGAREPLTGVYTKSGQGIMVYSMEEGGESPNVLILVFHCDWYNKLIIPMCNQGKLPQM